MESPRTGPTAVLDAGLAGGPNLRLRGAQPGRSGCGDPLSARAGQRLYYKSFERLLQVVFVPDADPAAATPTTLFRPDLASRHRSTASTANASRWQTSNANPSCNWCGLGLRPRTGRACRARSGSHWAQSSHRPLEVTAHPPTMYRYNRHPDRPNPGPTPLEPVPLPIGMSQRLNTLGPSNNLHVVDSAHLGPPGRGVPRWSRRDRQQAAVRGEMNAEPPDASRRRASKFSLTLAGGTIGRRPAVLAGVVSRPAVAGRSTTRPTGARRSRPDLAWPLQLGHGRDETPPRGPHDHRDALLHIQSAHRKLTHGQACFRARSGMIGFCYVDGVVRKAHVRAACNIREQLDDPKIELYSPYREAKTLLLGRTRPSVGTAPPGLELQGHIPLSNKSEWPALVLKCARQRNRNFSIGCNSLQSPASYIGGALSRLRSIHRLCQLPVRHTPTSRLQ